MARPKNVTPNYKHHKPTDTARCWIDGAWVSLGRYGSVESRQEHARILARLAAAGASAPAGAPTGSDPAGPTVARAPGTIRAKPADITVAEVLAAFVRHARGYYRKPDGTPTTEVKNVLAALRPVLDGFAGLPAVEFGPLALKAVRDTMIAAGSVRNQINKNVRRVCLAFKWAASEQLVPAFVPGALATVTGLRAGRSAAAERPPVAPVEDATVAATLPFLSRHVRGLVEFQRLTGCRPGEACALRLCDIDRGGPVWAYRPPHHKTAHHGKARAIMIGPKAQAVLAPFITGDAGAHLFAPRLAVEESRAARRAARTVKRYPTQEAARAARRAAAPKRQPADRYTVAAYGFAVRKAVIRANRQGRYDPANGPALPPVPHWHPHQLRHTFATDVRHALGLEAAQVALGHSNAKASEVYAERDEALAAAVAAKLG